MGYMDLSAAAWQQEYDKVSAEYESWKAKGLKLNMARGKPGKKQLELSNSLLTVLSDPADCVVSGVDARNYGELKGLTSARALFAELLGCKDSQVFVGGNASLQLMYDTVSKAYTHGLLHSEKLKKLLLAARADERFDYVLLDSPPMLLSADAEALSALSDLSVLVVRQDYTPAGIVNDCADALTQSGTDFAGFILNDFYAAVHPQQLFAVRTASSK